MQKPISENERLRLILEALIYCKKVKGMGMPPKCYSKALREPIFFLWEDKIGVNKYDICKFRSYAAKGVKNNSGKLVYDHIVPFKYVMQKLLELPKPTLKEVKKIPVKYLVACTITKEENDKLHKAGLASKMPNDKLHKVGLASKMPIDSEIYSRYKEVGIEFYEQ